jgi:hypothetical protein
MVRENSRVDTSRQGKWKRPEHRQRILDQFKQHPHLLEVVREYGYEAGDQWFEQFQSDRTAQPTGPIRLSS